MKQATMPLIILMAVLMTAPVSAQHYAGLVGGLNLASLDLEEDTDQFSSKLFGGVGGVLGFQLGENTYLHMEPMYLQKGARMEGTLQGGAMEATVTTSYVEIPVFLKQELGSGAARPYLMAGPTIGYRIDSKVDVTAADLEEEIDLDEITESYDLGLAFGGGLSMPAGNNAFFVEGRYVIGLTDILLDGTIEVGGAEQELTGQVKNRGMQFKAGFTIPLGSES